jgi:hypothetical protein
MLCRRRRADVRLHWTDRRAHLGLFVQAHQRRKGRSTAAAH